MAKMRAQPPALGLDKPTDKEEWRRVLREMGTFLATKTFLTNCPAPVMEMPVAPVHDSKEAMRFRAICDEHPAGRPEAVPGSAREAGGPTPTVGDGGCQGQLAVQMSPTLGRRRYRLRTPTLSTPSCTTPTSPSCHFHDGGHIAGREAWVARSHLGRGRRRGQDLTAMVQLLNAHIHVVRDPLPRVVAFDGCRAPLRAFFWGEAECGLILPSISAWEVVTKEKGATKGGYMCRYCQGFWKASRGGSRFLQITGEIACLPPAGAG